jgi:hypothetical protein
MAIDPLPTPPSRSDPANFSARADDFLAAIAAFASQANALAVEANNDATTATAAAQTAVNAPGTAATSTTSLPVGAGAKALAIQPGKAFVPGMFVTIARTSDSSTWMVGQITSYDSDAGGLSVTITLVNGGGTFTDWTVSLGPPVFFPAATVAQLLAATSAAIAVTPLALFAAAAPQPLADAVTITPDLAAGINFYILPVVANRTLGNPLNAKYGQSGVIVLFQDGTGGRQLAYGSAWKFPGGAPSLSSAPGACDAISYFVASPDRILCTLVRNFR